MRVSLYVCSVWEGGGSFPIWVIMGSRAVGSGGGWVVIHCLFIFFLFVFSSLLFLFCFRRCASDEGGGWGAVRA